MAQGALEPSAPRTAKTHLGLHPLDPLDFHPTVSQISFLLRIQLPNPRKPEAEQRGNNSYSSGEVLNEPQFPHFESEGVR